MVRSGPGFGEMRSREKESETGTGMGRLGALGLRRMGTGKWRKEMGRWAPERWSSELGEIGTSTKRCEPGGRLGTLGEIGTQGWGDGDKNQVVETEVWEMGMKEDANR